MQIVTSLTSAPVSVRLFVRILLSGFIFTLLSLTSCTSLTEYATGQVAGMLSGGGSSSVFTEDDDPELIADALPLAMKLYEALLAERPDDPELHLATGKLFVLYATAFLVTPASMLPDEEWEHAHHLKQRAKRLFARGKGYLLKSLHIRNRGLESVLEQESLDDSLIFLGKEDVANIYWLSAAWLAEYSCDPFALELASTLHTPIALLFRGLQLEPDYGSGAIHSLLISLYSSLPTAFLERTLLESPVVVGRFQEEYYGSLGIDKDALARGTHHFEEVVNLSEGGSPSPYISMAEGFAVKSQDYDWYMELLDSAIAIDPDVDPGNRLETIIFQEKAIWLKEHSGDFFLLEFENDD